MKNNTLLSVHVPSAPPENPSPKNWIQSLIRADSALATLSSEQLCELGAWLIRLPVRKICDKIATPAPDGFGLQVHRSVIYRLKQRFHFALHLEDLAASSETAQFF